MVTTPDSRLPALLLLSLVIVLVLVLGVSPTGAAETTPADGRSEATPAPRLELRPVVTGRWQTCCDEPALPDPSLDGGRRIVGQGELVGAADLAALQALTAVSAAVPPGAELTADGQAPRPGALAPDVLERFDGVDILTDTSGGLFIPPDSQIAVGPGVWLEATNTALLLNARAGTNPRTINMNDFFGEPLDFSVFDPKTFYDRFSRRFFLISVGRSRQPQQSFLYLAVSRSQTPAGFGEDDWCRYRIAAPKAGVFVDYPGLGVNETWVGVGVSQFTFDDDYDSAFVYAMPKASLVANANGCPSFPGFAGFRVETDPEGALAFTVQPAQHLSRNGLPGTPLFFVNTQFDASDAYTVWRLTGTRVDNAELLGEVVHTAGSYDFPPLAPQAGGGKDLQVGDVRVTHAVFRAGRLWAVHATACALRQPPNETCIRAVELAPGVLDTEVASEQTFGNDGWFYFWPAVSVNLAGDVVVAFQRSRADRFLDIAFTGRPAGAAHFEPPRSLQLGQCPLADIDGSGRNRTGDYVGIQTDPADNQTFWLAGEYAADQGVIGCSWKTAIGRVEYPGPEPADALARGVVAPSELIPSGSAPEEGTMGEEREQLWPRFGLPGRPEADARPKIR